MAEARKNVPAEQENKNYDFDSIRIGLASPELVMSWSYGEVTKPETINYRTFKPERDGLFCEKIFGPTKDWECNCGKYKKIRFRGVVCDRCGVEVTLSKVRRERMGHIKLAVPVAHIWYVKSLPSRVGQLLGVTMRDLERVLYYESYIVIDPGASSHHKKDLINEEQCIRAEEEFGKDFVAKMGAEAVRDLLKEINLDDLSAELKVGLRREVSVESKKDLLKRLRIVEALRQSGNRPEWMIMDILPVIPPDLRPLVPLEGGRFATSDLNDLYRRVLTRNNRLKKIIDMRAPEIILRNEKRMLQEAVDALLDNGRRSRAIKGRGNRELKSLSDILRGKQGRFRQNLLGKRVDYSGRSVIVVGPELKPYQCGLPKSMALELFKPFILKKLEEKGYVQSVKGAKRLVEKEKPGVWEILEDIVKEHPVLLNRAPTLHRLGIQAFEPVLIEGKAIRIHPLVCAAFNADFDGDQMAVHVPLSYEAQIEAATLMLSSNNILLPASGKPVITPKLDIVIGCYYLTKPRADSKGQGKVFAHQDEVILAHHNEVVDIHAKIKLRLEGRMIETTVGRVLFNEIVPKELGYVNETMFKKALDKLAMASFRKIGSYKTAMFMDEVKKIGFKYATQSGVTISLSDIIVPSEKQALIDKGIESVEKIKGQYRKGVITDTERYNKVIDIWTHVNNQVTESLLKGMAEDKNGFNPVFMLFDSEARGTREQVRQLGGMRGLMAKPQKRFTGQEIIETPILNNFREGLTVVEYFISTHGARKGLADTALKTSEAGYLTRRLVDVAQDIIITEDDCGTILGDERGALKEGEDIIETLKDRILGRVAMEDVVSPITGEVIVSSGQEINEEASEEIEEAGIEKVKIRSVLTCEAKRGLCRRCYGRNLGTGHLVDMGEAIGVMGAQSIGEPGTQLTLRTFHIGGTSSRIAAQSKVTVKIPGTLEFKGLETVTMESGEVVAINRDGEIILHGEKNNVKTRYSVPYASVLKVADKAAVLPGDIIFEWDPHTAAILAEHTGTVQLADMVPDVTISEEFDDITGMRRPMVIESKDRSLYPHINIVDKRGKVRSSYPIPIGARIMVQEGQNISAGEFLAKTPREISKSRDITAGLPRVAELFEARKPSDPAVVTEIDGRVKFGEISKGQRTIVVKNENDEERAYLIPHGKHLYVREGDRVRAGEKLTEGSINPHDILRIKGPGAVQVYLVNEIQEVYRLNGVHINDKHIEVIVRQMLQKIKIEDPGDAIFIEGDQVDKTQVRDENERVMREGGRPATFQSLLMGITKSALSTSSFISAASFQETTRVLTEAAVQGKTDYLLGLKENVIVGRLIPAGTGLKRYRNLKIVEQQSQDEEELAPVAAAEPEFEEDEE
ncbi:MAG: DNA-directed RNA polymerase subunit beta' [Candidatus Edwardsbacteria bacterium]|nr:DNA-directed RNA polymerase subunit beta' [Candidatus Edwardsbacteria bacterium]MBU2594719.1 DNA-directed RNA polymerase subunit beta' [Candidatus Edwardsbacteria bacterium]